MDAFVKHTGTAVVINRPNIDTDQIIPKQFLKRIERTGFGQYLFYDWRFTSTGELIESFPLNDARFAGASFLIAGDNFGCGSSREHAPWSLLEYGFRVIIAPSFADIFYNNSFKSGLLPITLEEKAISTIADRVDADPQYSLTIDLEAQTVLDRSGLSLQFLVDPFRKHCLLNGLDDIGISLQYEDSIDQFETANGHEFSFLSFPIRT